MAVTREFEDYGVGSSRSGGRHGCLSAVLWLVIIGIVAACAMRMLPIERSVRSVVPEVVSFVPWLAIPALICLGLALLWRRWLLAIVSFSCVALLAFWHLGFVIPDRPISPEAGVIAATRADPDDNVMRLMTLNTKNGHADAAQVVQAVRERNVEVLALQEVSWSFLEELDAAGMGEVLPYHVDSVAGRWDNGGLNCLFSRVEMSDASEDLLPMDLSAMSAGSIDMGELTLRFVSCHPSSPHLGGQDLWSEGLSTIASLSEYDHRYVVMGDFNSTWNHASFRSLLGTSFLDASEAAGEGFHMTFPSWEGLPVPPLIEIDHIVFADDERIAVGGLETIRIDGTDHLALLATLEVRG